MPAPAFCPKCGGSNEYSTYVQVQVRSARTHHKVQQFLKAGRLCMDCNNFTVDRDKRLDGPGMRWSRFNVSPALAAAKQSTIDDFLPVARTQVEGPHALPEPEPFESRSDDAARS